MVDGFEQICRPLRIQQLCANSDAPGLKLGQLVHNRSLGKTGLGGGRSKFQSLERNSAKFA